jgi:hypothetical protein
MISRITITRKSRDLPVKTSHRLTAHRERRPHVDKVTAQALP